jgi:N-carbamoyl-L-amino-acid hydrolase
VLTARGDAIEDTVRRAVGPAAEVVVAETFNAPPLDFDPAVIATISAAAQTLGLRWTPMPSGAFHDAQLVANVAPTAMIFVPSHNGISHNPAEFTTAPQLAAGTRVLAAALATHEKSTK